MGHCPVTRLPERRKKHSELLLLPQEFDELTHIRTRIHTHTHTLQMLENMFTLSI